MQASWRSTGEGLARTSLRTLAARAMMHTQVTASDKYAEVPVCQYAEVPVCRAGWHRSSQ